MSKKNSVLSRLMPTPQSEPEAQRSPSQFPNLVAEDRHEGGKPMIHIADSPLEAAEQLAGPVASLAASPSRDHQANNQLAPAKRKEWGINRAAGSALGKLSEAFAVENELKAVKDQMETGQTIVELDPQVLEGSFIQDRMESSDEAITELAEQIKEKGQLVPILVRPHPTVPDRYQIAYGHRRVKAAERLGIKVRATVRKMTDEELIIAQGQENNARLDLTFIEKARFVVALESRGFKRKVIREALSVNEGDLSSLIAVGSRIPLDIIEAIGPAPGIGRPRWRTLMDLFEDATCVKRGRQILAEDDVRALNSDARFRTLVDRLQKKERPKPQSWEDPHGRRLVNIVFSETKCTLQIDQRPEPEFASFLMSKLTDIYREFEAQKSK
ncbi:plasmid partitioning protein RepB [Microvirga tunisiensis]|uniref:Plasmid partitioning protein RepB n=1 Tax=Microvirga tunisiensis TaxID=2108360 RepID=A0A5N7MV16_9HYPH|nr:plasmid partitioning protein RepB [Microvirga tunisiensis]MPR12893.1 plasmid partitioning protein RepB [Microvirga tunisiensis]MPR30807.1 plasmid partitioning protein RepB [Microvirga tunisiensis]